MTNSTWTQVDGVWKRKAKIASSSPPLKPDAELLKQGFPKEVSKAFQKAADEMNCVIWSRVPGKACTTLIDEGYNLKPFYVHGKSCDWGPMAGFVCQLPALNKSGASKMAYNLKEHLNSLKWLDEKQEEAVRAWNKEHQGEPDISDENKYREMGVAKSLFLPLSISEARKQELINKNFLPHHKIISPDLICGIAQDGIAQDKNQTVAIEYLMKKSATSNLWNLYHRNIYIKKEDRYISYLQRKDNVFSIDQDESATYEKAIRDSVSPLEDIPNPTKINTELEQLLDQLSLKPVKNNILTQFYPVNGIQSPYLAYRDEANHYKNAVSGDYDLFAVWPFTPNASFEMTTRISERASKPSKSDETQRLFIPVEAKENAVEITKSRNVFIEFIGTYQELEGKEDPELGNINDLVLFTAQMLNSLIRAQYRGQNVQDRGQFPNRAFHSDEGGRPGVDEIEYPIACFVPKSHWNDLKQDAVIQQNGLTNTAFVVENHVEFLSLVKLFRRRFYVFLHDGWLMHWMSLAAGKAAMTKHAGDKAVPDHARKYFKARETEIGTLGKNSLNSIVEQLKSLLTPLPTPPQRANHPEEEKFNDAQAAYKTSIEKFKVPHEEVFQELITRIIEIASKEKALFADARKQSLVELRINTPK